MAHHSSNVKESIHVLGKDVSTDEFIRRITAYKSSHNDEDPFCVENVSHLIRKLELWDDIFGFIRPYFAIKSQNNSVTRRLFHRLGLGYDCATKVEIENVLDTGCKPSQIVYANPYKQQSHLPIAFKHNILTVVDTVEEVDKLKSAYQYYKKEKHYTGGKPTIALNGIDTNDINGHINGHSPHNTQQDHTDYASLISTQRQYDLEGIQPLPVLLRIENATDLEDHKIKWSMSGKFGCGWDKFEQLVIHCKNQGTIVKGLSFHVGQRGSDADPWTLTVKGARACWDILLKHNYKPTILNIGGGFAGRDEEGIRPLNEIGQKIQDSIRLHFGEYLDEISVMSEPGTFISAKTQSIVASVISTKVHDQPHPSYHLSTGMYSGLLMYLIDMTNLPHVKLVGDGSKSTQASKDSVKSKLWGNSLDAADNLGTAHLPPLKVGDWIQFDELGDYYMELMTKFNSFPCPRLIYVCEERDLKQIEEVFGNDTDFKLVHVD